MSAVAPVLFDAPGPRARRRIFALTVVAALLAAGVVALGVRQLAVTGELSWALWGPLLDPSNEDFALVWARLGSGLAVTLQAASLSMVLALVLGTVVAMGRLMAGPVLRVPLVGMVELLRGLPVIVTLLLSSFVPRSLGFPIPDFAALVVGLVLYNMVIISEILRAGVRSLPRGQSEAGKAIGLRPGQTMLLVQLPQSFRSMLPSLISQLVVVVKDTALAIFVFVQVTELARSGQQIRNALDNPIQTFAVVAVIYVVLNLLLEKLATLVEARLSASRSGDDEDAPATPATEGARV
ncbi:amino acid ABC transporter permease [Pseudokineococcus sp. 1T1Z-3]|uniref:amino acid ABC transporter permease n=1 Tax=Pseudokineococcus sp. 1T1Z-3 TaxID=3132745 RepID=UPI00309F0508